MILLSVEAVEGSGRRCREMWMVVAVLRTSGLEMGEVQSRSGQADSRQPQPAGVKTTQFAKKYLTPTLAPASAQPPAAC